MTSAVPAQKIHEIMSELGRLLEKVDVDPFQLRRLEAEVERLWRTNAVWAPTYHATKAFIAIGKYQSAAALAAARNALLLAPNDRMIRLNVLNVFVGLIEVEDSIPLLRSMAATCQDDKYVVRSLIIKAADLMQLQLVSDLFKVYDSLSVNDPPAQFLRRQSCEKSLDAMAQYNLTDDALAARIKTAAGALRSASFDVFRSSRRTLGDGSVLYHMHVRATPEECAELNFRIADALVEEFDDPAGEFIAFTCRPVTDLSIMEVVPGDRL